MVSNGCHEMNGVGDMRVGIKAIELYFPKCYVEQTELEKFNGAASGKYTNGMGLQQMGFCDDYEDVCSLALNVTFNLLKKYAIDPQTIGFLEVGTETLIDKSKSVKTSLMRSELFNGNADIEGVDVKNACYGGTQALFHAIDWIASNYVYRKKLAIVVMTDIANYESGAARCTGGAGAVALLIGPNAPLVFDRGTRATYMSDKYDFYKPVYGMSTEYPKVISKLTIDCYMTALDECYRLFQQKSSEQTAEEVSISKFHAVLCHCPFYKLVQKSYGRLYQLDCQSGRISDAESKEVLELKKTDNDFWKRLLILCQNQMDKQVAPFFNFNRRIGNMYTASLYASLVSVISNVTLENVHDKRLLLFSYGSGVASSMFSMHFDVQGGRGDQLLKMRKIAVEARDRLDERIVVTPEEYTEAIQRREVQLHDGKYKPEKREVELFPHSWYLKEITDELQRVYEQHSFKSAV
ncbi:hypothetical protein M3Y94_00155000 [Aphelenchoides besseyi]|nr:hypothetical protein M3Y94_00155000 [Aphelenchoides besseyi]KAI6237128.1 hypothetical protein M3Y95_00232400 [Aphelenchoides besseyi]